MACTETAFQWATTAELASLINFYDNRKLGTWHLSVKLQIANVIKLHPTVSPVQPAAWGVSKEAVRCSEMQHSNLSEVESNCRVSVLKFLIKTQRSPGFMPRVWRQLFQNKKPTALASSVYRQNPQYGISASSRRWWHRWYVNLAHTTLGAAPVAAQLLTWHPPARILQEQHGRKLEIFLCRTRKISPPHFIQRSSLTLRTTAYLIPAYTLKHFRSPDREESSQGSKTPGRTSTFIHNMWGKITLLFVLHRHQKHQE